MLGLANNYDMIRIQGCIDAYPIRSDGGKPWENSWQAPISRYEFRNDVHPGCYLSSEVVFTILAKPFMHWESTQSNDGGFSMRWVGGIKLLLFAGTLAWLLRMLIKRKQMKAALALSALSFLICADPGITVYLNTMYAEFSAFFFMFFSISLLFILLGDEQPKWRNILLLGLLVVASGLSKIQHLGFGVLLCLTLTLSMLLTKLSTSKRLISILAISAVLVAAIQWWHIQSPRGESMRQANLTNTVLGAVLGQSNDPLRTTNALGLPEQCSQHAGKNWFSEGIQTNHPCPELLELSRTRIAMLAWKDPNTFTKLLWQGIKQTRPWVHQLLGKVEGKTSAPLPSFFVSWDDFLEMLPDGLHSWWFVITPIIGLLVAWRMRNRPNALPDAFIVLFLAGFPSACLVTVVLGDGLADVAKQNHLGTTSLLAFWLLLALLLGDRITNLKR